MTHSSGVLGSHEVLGDLPDLCESVEVDDGKLEELPPGEGEQREQRLVATVRLRFCYVLL